MDLAYSESAISIRDLDEAAILLAHGFRLLKAPVGQWTYEFASLDDYLCWIRGNRDVRMKEQVSWNIAAAEGKPLRYAKQVIANYRGAPNHPAMRQAVAIQRQFLIQLLRERPRSALWIVVRNRSDAVSFFGRNASVRVQEEMLSLL